jgi:putrescine aminotransferase
MAEVDLTHLREIDRRHLIHPFTDHSALHASGVNVIVEGEGCWLVDAEGNRLLDGLAGLWCVNVGYGNSRISEAIAEQSRRLPFYPTFFQSGTEPAIALSERLAELAPSGLSHALFAGSGTEANETALKAIRAFRHLRGETQRTKIVGRRLSYHGVTLAAASITGLPACRDPFDLPLPGFVQAPAPHPYSAGSDLSAEAYGEWCIEETARLFESEGPETISAMFVEPVQGAGGVIVPPERYLGELRNLTREHGILFVADEVITGFGRLGDWFASAKWSLEPDLITLAKGITSGYLPLGATLVSDEIAESLVGGGSFAHGHTYSGHPTCAAAALANIDEIERLGLVDRVRDDVGPYLEAGLRALGDHPAVAEVRACGLIGALELVEPGSTGPPTNPLGPVAAARAREAGVIVRGMGNAIAVSPPLIITRDEIDTLLAAVRTTLDSF